MRILWVKVGGLWPPDTGGRLRSLHLVSELSRRHHVSLATTHAPGEDPGPLLAHLPRCEVVSVPYALPKRGSAGFALALARSWLTTQPVDLLKSVVPGLREEVRRRLEGGAVDLCVADFLVGTANIVLPGPVPTLFFAHNVEHLIWRRLARVETSPWRRPLLEVEWRKLRAAEARACSRATLTVAVSEEDAALLAARAPAARVRAIPTGVDLSYFAPGTSREDDTSLVFMGSMDWLPNEDAVLHFLEAILPRVRGEVRNVSFTVVGRNPGPRLRAAAARDGIALTGRVEDIRPHVLRAAVFVVPLRVGGGTRLKIFEALAMGKAVVSTTVGAEGLPLVPGLHFVRADDPDEFAQAVVSLLRDPGLRRSLGLQGRRLVEERYGWPRVAEEFEKRCEEAVTLGRRHTACRPSPAARAGARIAGWLPEGIKRHARPLRSLQARHGLIDWKLRFRRALPTRREARTGDAGPIRSILYVCRGNIIRSPMAASLMRRCLADLGRNGVVVSSAGLYAGRGLPADPRARAVARSFGFSLDDHRARRLTAGMVGQADLIVALDSLIEAELRGRHPRAGRKITRLLTQPGDRPARPIDIPDPYDGDEEDIRRCFELLRAGVSRQASDLFARETPPEEVEACHAS